MYVVRVTFCGSAFGGGYIADVDFASTATLVSLMCRVGGEVVPTENPRDGGRVVMARITINRFEKGVPSHAFIVFGCGR